MNTTTSKPDLYQVVTDKIIASLEAGVAPWVRPWVRTEKFGGMPYNASTGKRYRGINVALLYAPQYPTSAWMTFNQAKGMGGHVRAGEKGSTIVFYKPLKVTDRNAQPDANGVTPTKMIPLLQSFSVFNVAQIDGLPQSAEPEAVERPTSKIADAMMAIAEVRVGGDEAFYSPSMDFIAMPEVEKFTSIEEHAATALHELTHWTGHKSRCAREYSARFGDTAYAREELVAEMGSAFLCSAAGLDGRLQHAEYIANWLSVLQNDKRAVVVAASAAQKAADYVFEKSGVFAEADDAEAVEQPLALAA